MAPHLGAGRSPLLRRAREERDAGNFGDAERLCRDALDANPTDAETNRLLATVLYARGRHDEALECFREAARLAPGDAKVHRQLAEALAQRGELVAAEREARVALELRPDYVGAAVLLAAVKTFSGVDDPDLALLDSLGERARDDDARTALAFAQARAYEQVGGYDRAFEHLRVGNALRRRALDYDVERDLAFLARIARVFDAPLFERFAGSGSSDHLPILIVGMPRSGTTLVEQILASHPAVHAAGERQDLHELATAVALLSEDKGGYPEGVPRLRAEDLARLGEGYVSRLRSLAGDAALRVTDKAPMNFCHVGFAQLAIPAARVVHCMRDPLDTCVSCYSLDFETVPCAYDLTELGRYYRGYVDLMAHWRRVLPHGVVLDVRYEDLVFDLEPVARRIVAHCGLPWDDACLRFHATERVVHTSSFAQVRRPVYRTSVERWRRFERHLGPLLEALGPALAKRRELPASG